MDATVESPEAVKKPAPAVPFSCTAPVPRVWSYTKKPDFTKPDKKVEKEDVTLAKRLDRFRAKLDALVEEARDLADEVEAIETAAVDYETALMLVLEEVTKGSACDLNNIVTIIEDAMGLDGGFSEDEETLVMDGRGKMIEPACLANLRAKIDELKAQPQNRNWQAQFELAFHNLSYRDADLKFQSGTGISMFEWNALLAARSNNTPPGRKGGTATKQKFGRTTLGPIARQEIQAGHSCKCPHCFTDLDGVKPADNKFGSDSERVFYCETCKGRLAVIRDTARKWIVTALKGKFKPSKK